MPDLLSVNALANKDFILLSLGTRFITNLITFIGALWSYIEYGNPVRPADSTDDSGLYGLVILIFLFFAVLFVNDVSSLPVNIFYLWSLLSGTADLSNKWIQTIGFGSPIVSAGVFAFGTLVITSIFSDSF